MKELQIDKEEEERFEKARLKVLSDEYEKAGIGTYNEKTLHRIVKYYLEPDDNFHEIKHLGSVADIKRDNEIFEIQTLHFAGLCTKLDKFLNDSHVTVVYPLPYEKYIRWIDGDTKEISKPRKSPKRSTVYDAAYEIYNIRSFISRENLSIRLLFINVDEFKRKGGRVAGRRVKNMRADRIPKSLVKTIDLNSPEDYRIFIPCGLKDTFTATAFGKAISPKFRYGYSIVQILLNVGIIEIAEKTSRKTLYRIKNSVPDDK